MQIWLVVCFFLGGEIYYKDTLNTKPYKTWEDCNEARDNPIIRSEYRKIHGQDVIFMCREIRNDRPR